MAQQTRANQLIFGLNGGTTEFGKIGSDAAGTPETTKDLEAIQSLSQYLAGLYGITASAAEPPRIEDLNALYFLMTSQLRYLFQNGVPEWHEDAEYFATVSYCQRGGVVYRSVTNDNVGNDPATDDGTNWEAGDASLRQLKFDLDRLGFTGYALYTDKYLADKLRIARRMSVGDTIISSVSHTPTAFADAQSTAHPTYPEYFPAIPRHDADHDISTAQVPQWVIDVLNSEKLTFGSVSDFTATLASGVLTFGAGTENTNLLAWVTEQALVARWYASSEAANYGSLGGLFTGTAQLSVTIAGVNYAVTGCSLGSRTITLATAPADGSVTVAVYPCRIAGSTTSSRLRRLSGEALVAAGDVTGEVTVGGRRMGKLLGHIHISSVRQNPGVFVTGQPNVFGVGSGENTWNDSLLHSGTISSDGANTLVTGKSNDPRTAGMAVYTHLGVVLATNWT